MTNPDYWVKRWSENMIGWHKDEVNPTLKRYSKEFLFPDGCRVLVPLCGKSLDLGWLADQGHEVVGIEVAEQAIVDFFTETGREYTVDTSGDWPVYTSGAIEIHQVDFFEVKKTDVGLFDAVYDRAAIVAMAPERRAAYGDRIFSLMKEGAKMLLVTIDYDQEKMSGPPFAVPSHEVKTIYDDRGTLVKLDEQDVLVSSPKFAERGLDWMRGYAFLYTRTG